MTNQMSKDRLVFVSLVFAIVTNIILWVMLAGKFGIGSERAALHFNVVYGIDFLGSSRNVYELPAAGLVILIANTFLGGLVYERHKLFTYFLFFGSFFIQMIILIAALAIIFLNA